FSTSADPTTLTTDDLATSVTVAANVSGSYTGYAYFMKAGPAKITAKAGDVTAQVDVNVTQVTDAYKVIAIDSAVVPGGISVVTGEVKNAWGFPVVGALVDLSLGSSKIATLGNNQVTTNNEGVWSTTLTGASDGDGEATLTAIINGQVANAT